MNKIPEQFYRLIVEASPAAMILVDQDGLICFANRAAESLFGYSEGALLGHEIEILVPQDAHHRHQQLRAEFVRYFHRRSMGSGRFLYARRQDGSLFPAEIGLTPIQAGDGWYTLSLVIDLTLLKEAEDRITRLATELEQANEQLALLASTDALTGLYNRREFDEQLDSQIHLMKRMGHPLSLLLIDLDGFKKYNDRFGHLAGDQVLKTMAELFSQNIRTSDIIARFGGEEFVVILPDTTGPAALHLAERLRMAIHAHPWEGVKLTISLGAATLTFPTLSSEAEPDDRTRLFSEADQALYYSKSIGRNQATHFSEIRLV
jgi:diguanylate cyclase (GGDEF)-like protein/PAS domain S-box-containing protein